MKELTSGWALTSHLFLNKNQVEIIDCLVDHCKIPSSFNEDHIISFCDKNDFYIILYFSEIQDKKFHMYIVRDFRVNINDLILLYELFGKLISDGLSTLLLQQARQEINQVVHIYGHTKVISHKDEQNFYQ